MAFFLYPWNFYVAVKSMTQKGPMKNLLLLLLLTATTWGAEVNQFIVVYPGIPEELKAQFRDLSIKQISEASDDPVLVLRVLIIRSEGKHERGKDTMALLVDTDKPCDLVKVRNSLSQSWPIVIVIDTANVKK